MMVWEVLALADGGANGGSSFVMTAGNLVVAGNLEFECELGDHDPEFLQTGGLAAVNGDVSWSGIAPGSGTPRMVIAGAQLDLNGEVGNTVGSTVDMYLEISNGANVEANGSQFTLLHSTDSITITGGALRLLVGAGIINNGVFHDTGGDVYAGGNSSIPLTAQPDGIYAACLFLEDRIVAHRILIERS